MNLVKKILFLKLALLNFCLVDAVKAQVIPDKTLPTNSKVKFQDDRLIINEGTRNGNNLFHSFEKFSLPTGKKVLFNNDLTISNIFSRVTGKEISNIDGLIKANGSANLFFLNPNGIIFGPNAKLNIGGSFIGTTASSINFRDGTIFSALPTKSSQILTVNVPIGLNIENNNGSIRVLGNGHQLAGLSSPFSPIIRESQLRGLSVQPGKSITLVGNGVTISGGILNAPSGKIEILSVKDGQINISPSDLGWKTDLKPTFSLNNIDLQKQALLDASLTENNSSISLYGSNIKITDGSVILIQNQGAINGRKIHVFASETLKLNGFSLSGTIPSSIRTEALGIGKGGNIHIFSQDLIIQDGTRIGTRTYSSAIGGDLNILATGKIQLLGFSPTNVMLTSSITASSANEGSSGNVNVKTNELTVTQGGNIGSVTLGAGSGGNVNIFAKKILLSGTNPILAPSTISGTAFNTGKAGHIKITTTDLIIQKGAGITSSSIGVGKAGDITINASNININGSSDPVSSVIVRSNISSSIVLSNNFVDDFFHNSSINSNTSSGSVTIKTENLTITNQALISVGNKKLGKGGQISIQANSVVLDQSAKLLAATAFGFGGNITIDTPNFILRNGSSITATANVEGNGGNIQINTDNLVLLDASQITANAFLGNGGNIQINAAGVFLSPESNITASSEKGIDGTVEVKIVDDRPDNLVQERVVQFIPAESLINESCLARRVKKQGSFVYTGMGGKPVNPDFGISDWEILDEDYPQSQNQSQTEQKNMDFQQSPTQQNKPEVFISSWLPGDPLVEGTTLVTTEDGRVWLVAVPERSESLICN